MRKEELVYCGERNSRLLTYERICSVIAASTAKIERCGVPVHTSVGGKEKG